MTLELVITAVGSDRPGIASEFTGPIHEAGANLADTRMINLRGQFALIALVEGTSETLEDVKRRLAEVGPRIGLTIEYRSPSPSPGEVSPKRRESVPFRLKTYSMDQPGIVHRITSFLRDERVNIEELVTRLESAPFMGAPVFTMEILMLVPKDASVRRLREALERLGDELNCDVDLEPA